MGRSAWRATTHAAAVACGELMARLGLGLAALGRPGYLNVGHGAELGADRQRGGAPGAHLRGARFRLRGRDPRLRRRPLLRARPRSSSASGCARATRRRDRQLQVGLRLHRRLGGRRTTRRRSSTTICRRSSASCNETREHLGEWLKLYQIHSATPESGVLDGRRAAGGDAGDRPAARRVDERHAPGGDDRPRRSSSACSTPCRRPGTCTSARLATRWRALRAA